MEDTHEVTAISGSCLYSDPYYDPGYSTPLKYPSAPESRYVPKSKMYPRSNSKLNYKLIKQLLYDLVIIGIGYAVYTL